MNSRYLAILLLCVVLTVALTACAAPIESDESTWSDQITLGTTESTSSTATTTTTTTTSDGDSTSSVTTTTTTTTTGKTSTNTTPSSSASTTTTTASSAASGTTTTSVQSADITVGYVNTQSDSLHARSGPGTSYQSIGGIPRGDRVEILGRSGDWYLIKFGSTQAYVNAQYISATPVQ